MLGLSKRVITAYPSRNQSNWHKLVLEGKMQRASGLVRTRSWHRVWIVLLRSVIILPFRQSKVVR